MEKLTVAHGPFCPTPGEILVIGYGNVLRGDDAIGPQVAKAVAAWGWPGVRALAVPQLTPELAEELAAARLVVFVDAGATAGEEGVRVNELEPAEGAATLAHASDPGVLLALTRAVYGHNPRAWAVTVPAVRFELGEALSRTAAGGVEAARRWIAGLLERAIGPIAPRRKAGEQRDLPQDQDYEEIAPGGEASPNVEHCFPRRLLG
jgi:hydrogenase maturation protease